jgi:hypothetical protein
MELEFMLVPVEDALPNFTAPIAEQVSTFRQDFFENFLLRGDAEMPILLYGRNNFPTPDGDKDCIFFTVVPFKEMVPALIEAVLGDGAEWVMQVSEVNVYEANPDGTKKDLDDVDGEAVVFAAYAPGWQEFAMHYFHRPIPGDMPEPLGDWHIHGENKMEGALVPFSGGQKGH